MTLAITNGCGGVKPDADAAPSSQRDNSATTPTVVPSLNSETVNSQVEENISGAAGAGAQDVNLAHSANDSELNVAMQLVTGAAGAAAPSSAPADVGQANMEQTTSAAPAKLGRESLGSSPLPCEMRAVLETSCQGCHARVPGALAPMSLTSREDLLAPAISQPERSVYELVKERVHNDAAPMPPATSRRLTDAELATLDQGLYAELAVGPETCGGTAPTQAMFPEPDPSEIEQCYPFRAYASGNVAQPFRVPSGENYGCFAFDLPWQDDAQAVSIRIHRSPVVHHWILFDEQLPLPEGTVLVTPSDCSIGAATTYAIGQVSNETAINMPPSVGMALPAKSSGLRMMLSVHYFNMGEAMEDTSGVEVCVARKPRAHSALPHTVGSFEFDLPPHQSTEIVSYCTPTYQGDIHLIQQLPHMHEHGTRLSTIVERANGTSETLIDVPFDFNNQITYTSDMVLEPGDRLKTTCYFQNDSDRTIRYGTSTEDEMCGNTIMAWPAGSLHTGSSSSGGAGCFQ